MSSINCRICGSAVELPANFCGDCGSRITDDSADGQSSESEKENPGNGHLTHALKLALGEDPTEAIQEARLALQVGLAARDEIVARAILGSELLKLCDPDSDEEEEVMLEGIDELDKALIRDGVGGHGFFLDPLNRAAWMTGLEPAHAFHARKIHKNEGVDRAIEYLKDKLQLFDYWPGVHMSLLNFELGSLYREKGDFAAARKHWSSAVDAEPLSQENEHELRTKQMARNNLKVLEAESGAKHVIERLAESAATMQVSTEFSSSSAATIDLADNETLPLLASQTCWTCNAEVELPASFCDMCGDALGPAETNQKSSSKSGNNGEGIIEIYGSLSEGLRVVIAIGIGLLLEALFLGTGLVKADLFGFNVFYLPLLFGLAINIAKPDSVVSWVESLSPWLTKKRIQVAQRNGYISRYFVTPLIWGLTKIMAWTDRVDDRFLKSGLRITSGLYFTFILTYLAFVALAIALAIVFLMLVLAVIGLILGEGSGRRSGWSEERTGLFGDKYVQHYDEAGGKSGWSEKRTGLFGDEYIQHYDQSGSKEAWSEERTGIFGDEYKQHYDQGGKKSGWSEERTGLFGDKYTQHHDQGGSKTGSSEEKTGLFGDKYIEHHGSQGAKGSKSSEK